MIQIAGIGWVGSGRSLILSLVMLITVLIPVSGSAQDGGLTVAELQNAKGQWGDLLGAALRVEGRVSSVGSGQFRLQKCDLPFVCREDSLLRTATRSRHLEIRGQLAREEGGSRIVFRVSGLVELPTELERLRSRVTELRQPTPEQLYEVAEWGLTRAKFYEDKALLDAVRSMQQRAITAELAALAPTDTAGRLRLGTQATSLGLAPEIEEELVFEVTLLEWKAARSVLSTEPEVTRKLIATVLERHPAAGSPQIGTTPELQQKFTADPLKVYVDADAPGRRRIVRLLYVDMQRQLALSSLAEDGSNAAEVAEKLLPIAELANEVRRLQSLHFDYRLAGVVSATRTEAQQLADDLRRAERVDDATRALQQWQSARTERLRLDGAPGLVQAGDETLELLDDLPAAVALWQAAYKLDPKFPDAAARLKGQGYRLEGANWTREAAPAVQVTPIELKVGINRTQLRQLLGGPSSIRRIITGRGVIEIWVYGLPGQSGLAIELGGGGIGKELTVVSIENL